MVARRDVGLPRFEQAVQLGAETKNPGWNIPFALLHNPVTGREQTWGELEPVDGPKRVVIVGAGPAGMEAARTAAMRGHDVVLFERDQRMGGQVNLVMTMPKRGNFEEVILWFERQLPKLGVDVRLGVEADAKTVPSESPDVILVATGSTPFVPEVTGANLPHVHTAREVLADDTVAGRNILVFDVGGRAAGATTADHVAAKRPNVRFVTGMETVASEIWMVFVARGACTGRG